MRGGGIHLAAAPPGWIVAVALAACLLLLAAPAGGGAEPAYPFGAAEREISTGEPILPPAPVATPAPDAQSLATPGPSPHPRGTAPMGPPPHRFLAPYPHPLAGKIEINGGQGRVALVARDAPLRDVLALLAQSEGLNIVCAEDVNALVSVTLRDVALEDALTALVASAGCTWIDQRGIIHVSSIQGTRRLSPSVQGRHVRVFRLDYASARDLDLAVKGLLSPVGTSYILETSPLDNRKSAESIVVEDLAEYLCRVEEYLLQVDQPPRQVSIQAHVLQVELGQNNRHGVNFEHLIQFANKDLRLEMTGFAAPNAPQAFFAQLNGGNLGALIEALCTTNHAKTLASPQVMVVNGQESRIQVGEQLGFRVTTTTETSTLESVEFLDVGVVLTFTPRISRDGHILLRVKPEVSSGQVNPETGLPEEETTEVETDVLLRDGQAIVIGGLIQEKDNETQSKLPFLGDLWLIGKLFQRKQREKTRSEIIVALTPRIVPFCDPLTLQEREAIMRVKTPLFQGPLIPMARPWETQLPDAWSNPAFPQRLPTVEWWEPPLVGDGSPAWLPPTNLPPANLPSSGSLRGVAPAEELPPAASWEYQPVEPAP